MRLKQQKTLRTITNLMCFFSRFYYYLSSRIQPVLSGGTRLGRDGGVALRHSLPGDGDKAHRPQLSPPVRLCRYVRCLAQLLLKRLDSPRAAFSI